MSSGRERKTNPPGFSREKRMDVEKTSAFEDEICASSSSPESSLMPLHSPVKNLENQESIKKSKPKKPPSKIPRFLARKGTESDEGPSTHSKSFVPKEELDDVFVKLKKLSIDSSDPDPIETLPPCETEENGLRLYSPTFKSSQDEFEFRNDAPHTSVQYYREDVLMISLGTNTVSSEEKINEALRQERIILNFYETAKSTTGSLLDRCGIPETPVPTIEFKGAPDFTDIQSQYDFTLKEVSSIWRNTISLIRSIKGHAVNFVEKHSEQVDKEQLILEAEMLQLALDFAINYSKLKSDILIELVRKHLKLGRLDKSEVENFMDLKVFPVLYTEEDLAAMAQTVQELNVSLLGDEE